MLPRSILAGVTALAARVVAQPQAGTTTVTRGTTTTSNPSTTHTVAVGDGGFKFSPNEVRNAAVGDIIEFVLYPGNHSVARSDFGKPCLPYEYTGSNRKGFFSGYIGPAILVSDLPTFHVRVNDTDPIFFYCTAPGSCFQQHMIGVINPNEKETLDLQQQYAANATYQLAPDEPFPSETVNPTSTARPTGAGAVGGTDSHDHHGLSGGAIAGIAIGGAAVLVLAGALVFLCGRRGGLDKAYRRSTQTFPPPAVEEAKYQQSHNPKSPGQETYSTAHYSMPPAANNDPYRATSPHAYNSSPPPGTPGSQPAYGTYSSAGGHPNVQSPLMGGMADGAQGYYPGMTSPPAEIQTQLYPHSLPAQPVELPTSVDPGNSPLPGYQSARTYSWHQGQETQYRPGSKA